jgi:hypothetical protein
MKSVVLRGQVPVVLCLFEALSSLLLLWLLLPLSPRAKSNVHDCLASLHALKLFQLLQLGQWQRRRCPLSCRISRLTEATDEALKCVFEDKLNQELEVLRESHYFRNDEISRASQKRDEE